LEIGLRVLFVLHQLAMNRLRKNVEDVLEIDVHLSEELDLSGVVHLSVEMLKSLMFQRKQIPLTVDIIKKDLASSSCQPADDAVQHGRRILQERDVGDGRFQERDEDDQKPASAAASVQAALRLQRLESKQKRTREKYLKRAGHFAKELAEFQASIVCQLNVSRDLLSICYLFGASPLHPKEVYEVALPGSGRLFDSRRPSSEKANRKAMLALFKAMMSSDKLSDRFGRNLIKTNLFVALKKKKREEEEANGGGGSEETSCSGLISRPEFKIPPKCKRTLIRMVADEKAGVTLETPSKVGVASHSRDTPSMVPVPMDLCTPLVDRKSDVLVSLVSHTPLVSAAAASKSEFMLETPCAAGRPVHRGIATTGPPETPCSSRPVHRGIATTGPPETPCSSRPVHRGIATTGPPETPCSSRPVHRGSASEYMVETPCAGSRPVHRGGPPKTPGPVDCVAAKFMRCDVIEEQEEIDDDSVSDDVIDEDDVINREKDNLMTPVTSSPAAAEASATPDNNNSSQSEFFFLPGSLKGFSYPLA